MMLFKKILVCLILFVLLPAPLLAATQSSIKIDLPSSKEVGTNIGEYIKRLYEASIGVGGIAAMAVIVFGAIYITLSGSTPQKRLEGKSYIIAAIWGIVLLLGAYIILNTINPELVTLSPPGGETLTPSKKDEIPDCPLSVWKSCTPQFLKQRMQLSKLLDCGRDHGDFGMGCEQDVFYIPVTPPIEVEQIHRYPFYPSKVGPQDAECVVYHFTDVEGTTSVLSRRGLKMCTPIKNEVFE